MMILDNFATLADWRAIASGRATVALEIEQQVDTPALRMDFDFHGGGGFVVARKEVALSLPESFAIEFRLRGEAPSNIFEFKLVDASGLNVWRYREETCTFDGTWRPYALRDSQIEFAWGPLGGGPPRDIAAIEVVIAAGEGGRGTVNLAELTLRDTTYRQTPVYRASSALPGHGPEELGQPEGGSGWHSQVDDQQQWLQTDFREIREFCGLMLHWEKALRPWAFAVRLSADGQDWATAHETTEGAAERTWLYLPETKARFVRIELLQSLPAGAYGLRSLEVLPHALCRTIDTFFESVAQRTRRGLYPRPLLRQQSHWTPIGTPSSGARALMNEEGLVEVDKGAFSIEPFLYLEDRLITWADAEIEPALEEWSLPLPSSIWQLPSLTLTISVCAIDDTLYLRYRVSNRRGAPLALKLFTALRPFQVTPSWQHWRDYGGVARITELAWRDEAVWVNGIRRVIPLDPPPEGFGASRFAQGAISEYLADGLLPEHDNVRDAFDRASGALAYDIQVPAEGVCERYLAIPWQTEPTSSPPLARDGAACFARAARQWHELLSHFEITLPDQARALTDTVKTAAAHILINRDGAALHPGPRRYDRAWIRDGAIMAAALLRLGQAAAVRDFVRWYAGFQTEDGNLPDAVDREGCEWLPEFDAYGQFAYLLAEYHRHSGDRELVAELWPAVQRALTYQEGLRSQRLTETFLAPEKRACYGLLPESMSHEGYMAHPVHAYWDDFWALRGLKDAVYLAQALDDDAAAKHWGMQRDDLAECLYASLALTIQQHKLDFLPGSVEFADFDPAATAAALAPIDELHRLPRDIVDLTYDRYLEGFRRRQTSQDWSNYSPYEVRIVGALIRLGRRADALELIRSLLADRRPLAWNQWPEIAWRDPLGPSFLGDLPHSWIGAEYILSALSLFAYERESDQALVLAAGVDAEWLDHGVTVRELPTHFGRLSYRLRRESPAVLHFTLEPGFRMPPGGFVLVPPVASSPASVECSAAYATLKHGAVAFRTCPVEARLTYPLTTNGGQ